MKREILKSSASGAARIVFTPDNMGLKYSLQTHTNGWWHSVEWFDSFYQALQYWEKHRIEDLHELTTR